MQVWGCGLEQDLSVLQLILPLLLYLQFSISHRLSSEGSADEIIIAEFVSIGLVNFPLSDFRKHPYSLPLG